MKTIFCVLILFLSSCASISDFKLRQAKEEGRLRIGMSYDELIELVGKKPAKTDILIEETDSQGDLLIWHAGLNWEKSYIFTFRNRHLESWKIID